MTIATNRNDRFVVDRLIVDILDLRRTSPNTISDQTSDYHYSLLMNQYAQFSIGKSPDYHYVIIIMDFCTVLRFVLDTVNHSSVESRRIPQLIGWFVY